MTIDATKELTRVLSRALRALGEAGQPAHASSLAAAAWAVLRRERPADAERLNGILHYLARLPDHPDAAPHNTKETTMTTEDRQLDVRSEPPARRHELIFETYTALSPGEGFVLVNDHDPKPLYYQLAAEHAGAFSWEYKEQGPQTWRVRIGRTAPDAGA
ncbi:hypothetical protein [Acidothermus cellulolyticus 11B] [Mycobacterium shimoidei]|uniref:DUF2249 domain-containing protein n=1 Tax=Mycobacterium shimoidei TaxID=29313 RepID=A0A375YY87_MYCSH|nr:DUF2249 domain-containing protein [Mycobacterium shimoidei]SRX93819.1 hypothetical protein [Acidothermus cellulolyticus 11B] [Mycobacterium shimoidei]